MVLDDKDREKPWYKGLSNMNDDEIDGYWKKECRSAMWLIVEMLILAVIGVILMFIDAGAGEKTMLVIMGADAVVLMVVMSVLDGEHKRIKLVREERRT